ncbi:alpha-N-acetylgalactosaminidase-like [Physella acuta]|uniref:alpha-N-acetylgalactosaminidase-like n=1 Tax=Physella acuta TaxID=109671 RepID=UPI0027DC1353|nr:alpha-N-acetylgalactosaminidase-like [Physella acuta]
MALTPQFLCLVLMLASPTLAVDNGLARTPPMGWLSWQRFRCNLDCANDPLNCISERLYKDMADRLAADGYRDAGYVYVNIDDCWAAKQRDPVTLRLVPDPDRFPSGIKALADYVHSKGLKLGIYGDMGTFTCGGYPGSKFTLETDATTFAEWGIDSLKLDGCYSTTTDFTVAYPIMEFYLNKTGRPILYSCSWPAYQQTPDYPRIAEFCNIWRNYADIDDSWDSVKDIIQFYGDNKGNFSAVAGPGNFNDPDMIIIGDKGLSDSQEEVQMALWSIMAAPLYLSNDLRNVSDRARRLIQNKGAIAINQDPLGIMGKRAWQANGIQGWIRPVLPIGSYAVAVLNVNDGGSATPVTISLATFGVTDIGRYNFTEVFTGGFIGLFSTNDQVVIKVDVSSVFFGKYSRIG